MARSWFKQWVTRFIPHYMERSLFVFVATCIVEYTMFRWVSLHQVGFVSEEGLIVLSAISKVVWIAPKPIVTVLQTIEVTSFHK